MCAFPHRWESIGSDAVNKDPDYSAAYCILETERDLKARADVHAGPRERDLRCAALKYLATGGGRTAQRRSPMTCDVFAAV